MVAGSDRFCGWVVGRVGYVHAHNTTRVHHRAALNKIQIQSKAKKNRKAKQSEAKQYNIYIYIYMRQMKTKSIVGRHLLTHPTQKKERARPPPFYRTSRLTAANFALVIRLQVLWVRSLNFRLACPFFVFLIWQNRSETGGANGSRGSPPTPPPTPPCTRTLPLCWPLGRRGAFFFPSVQTRGTEEVEKADEPRLHHAPTTSIGRHPLSLNHGLD